MGFFSGNFKFQKMSKDTVLTIFNLLQKLLRNMDRKIKLLKAIQNKIRPKNGHLTRVHKPPKI